MHEKDQLITLLQFSAGLKALFNYFVQVISSALDAAHAHRSVLIASIFLASNHRENW